MEQNYEILEAYIKNACKGIRDKETKEEVSEELMSHMLEIYDRNIMFGLTHQTAQQEAVKQMGDSNAVGKTFKQLYFVNTVILILKYISKFLNYINLIALLMFIPAKFGLLLFSIKPGTLTDNICANQIVITIFICIFISVISELTNVPNPKAPIERITESETHIKILVAIFLVICLCAFFAFDLTMQYVLVCFMHSMSIFTCSRIIKKL